MERAVFHVRANDPQHLAFCHAALQNRFHPCKHRICSILVNEFYGRMQQQSKEFMSDIVFLRRIGPDPHANGAKTSGCSGCPDIWELANGDFAVISIDKTEVAGELPPTAGCGPDEKIVRLPGVFW
ncbi:MAG: hypothetical protein WDN00_10145 [Limisphaerales bacterium]